MLSKKIRIEWRAFLVCVSCVRHSPAISQNMAGNRFLDSCNLGVYIRNIFRFEERRRAELEESRKLQHVIAFHPLLAFLSAPNKIQSKLNENISESVCLPFVARSHEIWKLRKVVRLLQTKENMTNFTWNTLMGNVDKLSTKVTFCGCNCLWSTNILHILQIFQVHRFCRHKMDFHSVSDGCFQLQLSMESHVCAYFCRRLGYSL